MPRLDESRPALINALRDHYGSLPTPGGESGDDDNPFQTVARVAVGLVTDSRAAGSVLAALRAADILSSAALAGIEPEELGEVLTDARVKLTAKALRPLQKLASWIVKHGFDDQSFASAPTETLREAWQALNGVGQATADTWLLFGLGRAVYPVDRATYRVLVRHGWLEPSASYDEARNVAEGLAPDQGEVLAQISLALAKLGREFCKPTAPHCEGCPLRPFLPDARPMTEVD